MNPRELGALTLVEYDEMVLEMREIQKARAKAQRKR